MFRLSFLKKVLFRKLGLKTYLRVIRVGFFVLYKSGLLKFEKDYDFHYFARTLIKPGDTVIDMGANLGYYTTLFLKWVGSKGKVYAIEPVPVYQEILTKSLSKKNNFHLLPYALGASEKNIEIVLPYYDGLLHTGRAYVKDETHDRPVGYKTQIFRARMKSPAELLNLNTKLDFIKCDIEGFEYVVFNEMREILKKHMPILQIEIGPKNSKNMDLLLSGIGYEKYILKKKIGELENDKRMRKNLLL